MSFTIIEAVPDDVNTIVELYFASFRNVFVSTVFPDVPTVRQWLAASIAKDMCDPSTLFLLAFANSENKIIEEADRDRSAAIGFAKWRHLDSSVPPTMDQSSWPDGADAAVANAFFPLLARAHVDVMGARPHWHLALLATLPASRGQGAGSILLQNGCDAADRAGEEVYLSSSPIAVRLYERFGFTKLYNMELEFMDRDGEKCKYLNVAMIRKPSSRAGNNDKSMP